MQIRDKILIESGYVTKAKVESGGIDYQYPYLCKTDKSDVEYKESSDDPRVKEAQQEENQNQQSIRKRLGSKLG